MGTIKPGENRVQLHLPESAVVEKLVSSEMEVRLHGSNMADIWRSAGAPEGLTLMRPTEVNISGEEVKMSETLEEPAGPWKSETDELMWDNNDSLRAIFTVNAEAVKAMVGYMGRRTFELGNVTVSMDSTEFNWAAITLTALDGAPIGNSSNILLVAAGRVENTDMGWNDDKTSVGAEWGEFPTRAEGIPAYIFLDSADRFRVYALDTIGNKKQEIRVRKQGQEQSFTIGAQYETLWYLLER
jgi:hypothetical protein